MYHRNELVWSDLGDPFPHAVRNSGNTRGVVAGTLLEGVKDFLVGDGREFSSRKGWERIRDVFHLRGVVGEP